MTGMTTCEWCKKAMTRHGLKSHKKLFCDERPDLVKARSAPPPAPLPEVEPTFRPVDGEPGIHACPCGKKLRQSRMYVHASACSYARQDGYRPPPERRHPCRCGCGGEVLSRGVKTGHFLPGHYDRWVRANYPERKREKPRPLAIVVNEREQGAMRPLEERDADLRERAERAAYTLITGEASYALWFWCLGVDT